MKKVMMLGATTSSIEFVKTAHNMGVQVVAVDKSDTSPAKKIADKAYTQSTIEIDKMIDIAKKENINGIITGYDDVNTEVAAKLCKKLKLPFYATEEQIKITKNKIAFKNLCKKFNVPVVKEYNLENIEFPCVVKPADSYSAKGINICYNEKELPELIEKALEFSKAKQFLIEKYMDSNKVDCVNIDYVLKDGQIKVSCIGDKKVLKQGNKAPITSAVVYPSKHQKEFLNEVDEKCQNMFKHLKMKDGTLFIESFYDEDGFHIYEMGYRVGGGQSSILLNKIMEVNYLEMLINFALTNKMCSQNTFERINPNFKESACGLLAIAKSGTIKKIEGLDKIRNLPEIINVTQYLQEGDTVEKHLIGTLGQSFARFHIVTKNQAKMKEIISYINENLKVYDNTEELMLMPLYQYEEEEK